MSDRLLIGTRKGLFRINRGSDGHWSICNSWFLGDPVSLVLAEPGGRPLHAALALRHCGVKMRRSEGGGVSWSEAPVPTYPEKSHDVEEKDPMRGVDLPWSTRLIWSLTAGAPGKLWCGTIPGGLFRSDDGGDSWELLGAGHRPLAPLDRDPVAGAKRCTRAGPAYSEPRNGS